MRVLNVTLNEEKKIFLSLTKIYGIGFKRSKKILKSLNINYYDKIEDLKEEKKEQLKKYLLENEKTMSNYLKRSINNNLKNEIILKTFKGFRHKMKMPVRGQRSRSNNKTNRKKQFDIFN